jgi:SAM-dependent methyltransferase
MQTERYRDLLAAHAPVVDVGCGRAELLEALQADGISCIGVDTDSGMVAEARARGLDVRHTDVVAFLEAAEDHSLGSVFSAHLAEHLELDVLIRFLELSARKLRPGGVFIAETPNPASLIVLGNSYILDPTHVRPLHPSLLAFLCETAGFRQVRLEFFSPATSYQLAKIRDADGPDWLQTVNANSDRLNDVLFGPQEYAVIATTPE